MTLQAIDHVQAVMPAGGEEQARACYVALLGLPETPKPADIGSRGGCWFGTGAIRLHLGAETPSIPARKAHIAFRVDDVGALTSRARAAGYEVDDDKALPGHERVSIFDPFGNRLEFLKPLSGESENS
jgi:catechol 2,3-dioxygenase-like lactoylglutathione lyase family enzyme